MDAHFEASAPSHRHLPLIVDTDPSSSFACDYVAGINRVLSLPPYLLIDNIGRNVELWRFESGRRKAVARARYDLTAYPGDETASLLDVDIHGAFLRRSRTELLTVNHFGRMRRFELPSTTVRMQPAGEAQLIGDTEHIVLVHDCFITSSPRGEHTSDPARPGVLLFEPLGASFETTVGGRRLACDQALADWGVVSALAATQDGDRLAAAAGQRLGVFELARRGGGMGLGACVFEVTLAFHCQWIHFDEVGQMWTAGHRPVTGPDAGDWNACRGGGIEVFTRDRGRRRVTAALPEVTAWGYGADPIVLAPDLRQVYIVGRDGSLHAVDQQGGEPRRLYDPLDADGEPLPSLGIGHAAMLEGVVYAGFSRGGFRLLRYEPSRVNAAG